MINLTQYSKDYIDDLISKDVKKVVSNNVYSSLSWSHNGVSSFAYDYPIKLVNTTIDELFREIKEPVSLRLDKLNLTQEDVDLLKHNPTNPGSWPYPLRETIRRVNEYRFNTPAADRKFPHITIAHITKGYSGINSIGQESSNNAIPFKRLESATTLLKQNGKHRHAMLEVGPSQYLYITNQWGSTLMFAMYSCMLLLFKHMLSEETAAKAEELALDIFTDRISTEALVHKLASIIVDPKIQQEQFRKSIQGIEYKLRVKEKQQYEKELTDVTVSLRDLEIEITDLWTKHSFLNRQIDYRNASPDAEDESNALSEFIMRTQEIVGQAYNPETQVLQLAIVNELEYYERDAFISSIRNKDSRWWETNDFSMSSLLTLIICFLTEKYSLITKSMITLNFARKEVNRDSSTAALAELREYMGMSHPHIMGISCFGSNRSQIIAGMGKGNYIGSVAQTIAACKNMNMTDRMAIGKLLEYTNIAIVQGKPFIKNNRTGEILDYAHFYEENRDNIQLMFNSEATAKRTMTQSKEDVETIADIFDKEEDNE